MEKDVLGLAPLQQLGEEIETVSFSDLADNNEARLYFEAAKARLLSVNNWHFISGITSGRFQLMNASGEKLERNVELHDYIRIDIPGPGSTEGDGYDWVLVEAMKEVNEGAFQSIGFRVRPTKNPLGSSNEIAHFYTSDATSTFMVTLEENKVTATIIDRNLKPNDESQKMIDRIRHTTVGAGAIGLFSKLQWKNLADALVKKV
jgi:hypothetical protein